MASGDLEVVVARFEEDTGWLDTIENAYVYQKGSVDLALDGEVLPDIGRESHTWLHHVVTHYDDLFPYTAFVQAHPFDHCSRVFSFLDAIREARMAPSFLWLCDRTFPSGTERFTDGMLRAHWSYQGYDQNYEQVFGARTGSEQFAFGAGGQFLVGREQVRRRPLSFYRNALSMFEEENLVDSLLAYQFERWWGVMFS